MGSPGPAESWRSPSHDSGLNRSPGESSTDASKCESSEHRTVQDATFLRDVRGTRRQAPVNQRPAGSKEGYVWLPKWISSTNYSGFVLWVHLDPQTDRKYELGDPSCGTSQNRTQFRWSTTPPPLKWVAKVVLKA